MSKDTYHTIPIFHLADVITKLSGKKRLQCLLIGNYGAYNFADEALLAGYLTEFTKIPQVKLLVAAEKPSEVKRLHESVRAVSLTQARKEIKKVDIVIISGISHFSFSYLSFLVQLLFRQRFFKKKIYFFAFSFLYKIPFIIKELLYALMRQSTQVTVRDYYTADMIKQKKIHVSVYQNPSIQMDTNTTITALHDPYFKRFYKKERINIGLSLTKPKNKQEEKHLLTEIVTFISKNYLQADFWFYASDHHPKQVNDEAFGHTLHEMIKKKIGRDVQFHFVPTSWHPSTFFSSIKVMHFMIIMCPTLALFSYKKKSNSLYIVKNQNEARLFTSLGGTVLKISDVTAKKIQANFS